MVQGPYRSVRSSMRKRGWVEQSYKGSLGDHDGIYTKSPIKKTTKPKADSEWVVCMCACMCVCVCKVSVFKPGT